MGLLPWKWRSKLLESCDHDDAPVVAGWYHLGVSFKPNGLSVCFGLFPFFQRVFGGPPTSMVRVGGGIGRIPRSSSYVRLTTCASSSDSLRVRSSPPPPGRRVRSASPFNAVSRSPPSLLAHSQEKLALTVTEIPYEVLQIFQMPYVAGSAGRGGERKRLDSEILRFRNPVCCMPWSIPQKTSLSFKIRFRLRFWLLEVLADQANGGRSGGTNTSARPTGRPRGQASCSCQGDEQRHGTLMSHLVLTCGIV